MGVVLQGLRLSRPAVLSLRRVDVHDQGTVQPARDAPDGTLVASFENLTFKNDAPAGISAFGLVAGGSAGHLPLDPDTKGVLVDNVVVERIPAGLMVFVQ